MSHNYVANPFQNIDVRIPKKHHEDFERYCQRKEKSVIDQSPFPRMIDFWFLSVCLATRLGLEPGNIARIETTKIIGGSIFVVDPWRISILMFIAIGSSRDVQIVSESRKMMDLLDGLAMVGIPKVIEMLQNDVGGGEPIWNLSDAMHDILCSD